MRILLAVGMALGLSGCVAAGAPSNYQSYFGVPVDSSPQLQKRFDHARAYCEREAPRRGTTDSPSVSYLLAMRSCLARHNFIDRGGDAYLATDLGSSAFLEQ
ncbi:hypothetical protein [Rhizobium tubonense]|uniref:Glycine zipper family protein n=1 Tax=Rhizobium tubonense TaxID=484088 RepID=A0A2W4CQF7_9HYPH|nr:hypothetical protein [Rhizobium tubonense]PZM07674.1 hypothetical protein CPY51_31435 [Rhizobium tubonense]